MWYSSLLEKDLLPDSALRIGIRKLLKQRLIDENKGTQDAQQEHFMKLIEELKNSPIAVNTVEANEQHYELPAEFFCKVLGKHLKYSSGYWKEGVTNIDTSEKDMLELTCQRAELKDGQKVLELGCGWGSLSLFMAEKFPNSKITSVSNSHSQKIFIDEQAKKRNLTHLTILTADMNVFSIDDKFDRVVSVEMFEHMRNYELLLKKVAGFLNDDGKLFVHIFTHREFAYKFEVVDETDWMSKYFFTGGIMPSDHLLLYFPEHFKIEKHWRVSGTHYQKTSEAWLSNMDAAKSDVMEIMKKVYGEARVVKWWVYWRIFFMACAELWGYNNGNEWLVSHYLFEKVRRA
ncbi:MAG TPA: cyclopropane-fatty-acyl-phospholipid synthase family protein [Bacteroidia bacterium]|nr:cyclopropane-fatty-acyl-phospholipid synthase family protein [Bacteroidia bacterium]